jgi:hypothetical protein
LRGIAAFYRTRRADPFGPPRERAGAPTRSRVAYFLLLLERFFDLLDLRLLVELLREPFPELRFERFVEPPFFGTFAPRLRASESPIAIACLRLWTFFPDRPLFNFPRLYSCIAFFTLRWEVLPYLAMSCVSSDRQRVIVNRLPRLVYPARAASALGRTARAIKTRADEGSPSRARSPETIRASYAQISIPPTSFRARSE